MISDVIDVFRKNFSYQTKIAKKKQIDIQVETIKRLFDRVDMNSMPPDKKSLITKIISESTSKQ